MLFLLLLVSVCVATQSQLEPIGKKPAVPHGTSGSSGAPPSTGVALVDKKPHSPPRPLQITHAFAQKPHSPPRPLQVTHAFAQKPHSPPRPLQVTHAFAKNNPHALLKMVDNANPDDIAQILQLLQDLIDEGTAEKEELDQKLSEAELAKTTASEAYSSAVSNEGIARAKHTDAVKVESQSKGSWDAATLSYNTEKPGLENEITVFQQVLSILESLLNQQPSDGALLELGSSEQGKLYQKLIMQIQADPSKINQIIDLVNGLLTTSDSALNTLEKTVNETKASYESASAATDQAAGELLEAEQESSDAKDAFDLAVASLEQTTKDNEARHTVLDNEEATLKDVITLLNQISDDQVTITATPTPPPTTSS